MEEGDVQLSEREGHSRSVKSKFQGLIDASGRLEHDSLKDDSQTIPKRTKPPEVHLMNDTRSEVCTRDGCHSECYFPAAFAAAASSSFFLGCLHVRGN